MVVSVHRLSTTILFAKTMINWFPILEYLITSQFTAVVSMCDECWRT